MFGIEREKLLFDYELTSAYSTGRARAGQPEYELCKNKKKITQNLIS
jgi:hypothetical protein